MIARCPIVINENLSQKGRQRVRWAFCGIFAPLDISATAEARNSKFCTQIDHEGHYRKNDKLGEKGRRGSCDNFREFCDALRISAMAEARNFKFGTQNDNRVRCRKKMKNRVQMGFQRVTWPFLEARNSKFVRRLIARCPVVKNENFMWKGVARGQLTILGPPPYLCNGWS